jgi:urease accessory protein
VWLPLATRATGGGLATTRVVSAGAAGAAMLGGGVRARGWPRPGQPFDRGRFVQQLELPGTWLDRGCIDASDVRLLDSPLGWAGRRVLATLWFGAGAAIEQARHEALLDAARALMADDAVLSADAGVTMLPQRVIVLRALAARVEPAMQLLGRCWAAWRGLAWGADAAAPRLWRT